MKKKPIVFPGPVVTAWAEEAHGPGWSNRLIWVICRVDTALDQIAIQPEDQTPEMMVLFDVSALAAREMTGWVKAASLIAKA